jgi:hypothetical protein
MGLFSNAIGPKQHYHVPHSSWTGILLFDVLVNQECIARLQKLTLFGVPMFFQSIWQNSGFNSAVSALLCTPDFFQSLPSYKVSSRHTNHFNCELAQSSSTQSGSRMDWRRRAHLDLLLWLAGQENRGLVALPYVPQCPCCQGFSLPDWDSQYHSPQLGMIILDIFMFDRRWCLPSSVVFSSGQSWNGSMDTFKGS